MCELETNLKLYNYAKFATLIYVSYRDTVKLFIYPLFGESVENWILNFYLLRERLFFL